MFLCVSFKYKFPLTEHSVLLLLLFHLSHFHWTLKNYSVLPEPQCPLCCSSRQYSYKEFPKKYEKKDLILSIWDLPLRKSWLKAHETYYFITIWIREYILGYIQNKATGGKTNMEMYRLGRFTANTSIPYLPFSLSTGEMANNFCLAWEAKAWLE